MLKTIFPVGGMMARPQIEIDPKEVYKLASYGCTNAEIADFCECSKDTIERRFAAELIKGRATCKIRLRSLQWKSAENGNAAMLIWLGKQELGQSDSIAIAQSKPFIFSYEVEKKDGN